jgi:alkanesulfonate monooxygenase SsuD/methylene tetrahydromethanopterin reductase-like flavin-dependent oxidoreductase (luciferase family)
MRKSLSWFGCRAWTSAWAIAGRIPSSWRIPGVVERSGGVRWRTPKGSSRSAETTRGAAEDFFPGYARAFSTVGKERGWPPVTRAGFDAQLTPNGALLVGNAEEVIEKIGRYYEALGGISRITFMMNAASLPHEKLMRAIELIGTRVRPTLSQRFPAESNIPESATP